MSASYKLNVQVSKYNPEKRSAIIAAANENWDFTEPSGNDPLYFSGEGITGNFEGRINELAVAIWKANGAKCKIDMQSLYLDDLPYDDHVLDYDRIMGKQ